MDEVLRERAEVYLLGRVVVGFGRAGPRQRSYSRERVNAQRRVRFEAGAAALTAVGALGEADVVPYRRRLEAALEHGEPTAAPEPDERVAGRARELLDRCLGAVAADSGEAPAPVPADDPANAAVNRFRLVHHVCRDCGALGEDELDEWHDRLIEVDGGRSWQLEAERRRRECRLTELVGVVGGSPARQGALRVLTVELYSDGVLVRWHDPTNRPRKQTEPGDAAEWRRRRLERASLEDDAATEYLHVHTQTKRFGEDPPVFGISTFLGAVPPPATRLTLAVRGESAPVKL